MVKMSKTSFKVSSCTCAYFLNGPLDNTDSVDTIPSVDYRIAVSNHMFRDERWRKLFAVEGWVTATLIDFMPSNICLIFNMECRG